MMAESSAGKAKVKSDRRITPSSTQPRRAEASAPKATPQPRPINTATTPTRIEVRAPTSSCETISRPRLSVPSQCAALGGASFFGSFSGGAQFEGRFFNLIGKGYSQLDGFGFVNAEAAVKAVTKKHGH